MTRRTTCWIWPLHPHQQAMQWNGWPFVRSKPPSSHMVQNEKYGYVETRLCTYILMKARTNHLVGPNKKHHWSMLCTRKSRYIRLTFGRDLVPWAKGWKLRRNPRHRWTLGGGLCRCSRGLEVHPSRNSWSWTWGSSGDGVHRTRWFLVDGSNLVAIFRCLQSKIATREHQESWATFAESPAGAAA